MAEHTTIERAAEPKHRRQIGAVVGILVSVMLLLSLVSYSSVDQANGEISLVDIWKVFTNDEAIVAKADHTHNWLGLLGAIISNWLINGTIGYAVIVLPVLLFVWSVVMVTRRHVRKVIAATSYTILLSLLFSSFAGTVKHLDDSLPLEWSGVVGHFVAHVLSKLVGLAGTVILIAGSLIVVLTLLADLDYHVTFGRFKRFLVTFDAWLRRIGSTAAAWLLERRKTVASDPRRVEIRRPLQDASDQPGMLSKADVPRYRPMPAPAAQDSRTPALKTPFEPETTTEKTDDLRLDIQEQIQEEEVDLDERPRDLEEEVAEEIDYVFPSVELLDSTRGSEEVNEDELKENAQLLRTKLADFGVEIESVTVTPGPVVTLYELVPATGVKISRIESLQDDIALALKARGIRIIAPIPGKGTVGVEIPNHHPSLVTFRSVVNSAKFRDSQAALPLAMGKTISGEVFVDDLTKMPHLLIAGATGSGKSVGINTIIMSLLYRLHPSDIKFVIIDPKKIELTLFNKLVHHYLAISPDIDEKIITTPVNAVLVLKSVEAEMERRYNRLAAAGVRNIADYNERVKSGRLQDSESTKHRKLPYLVIVVDELADLMITAAREVEEPIARLAQLARAVGIHLVLATQRPSVDVITGVIKANFPARVAYQVSSKIDSRTILDMNGADQLLGNGDLLYLPAGSPKPIRIQNAFISTDEVERIMNHIGKQKGFVHPSFLPSAIEKKRGLGGTQDGGRDELFEEAARIIVRHQQGSVSLLQRRLKVGYSRAARLVDELEAAGIVGPFDGSKAREVLCDSEATLETILKNLP